MLSVSGSRSAARTATVSGAFLVGLLASGALMTIVIWVATIANPVGRSTGLVVAAVALIVLAVMDLELAGLHTITTRRQTFSRLQLGSLPVAYLVWGLDIGTTVSTVRATSLYWATLLLVVASRRGEAALSVELFLLAYFAAHLIAVRVISRRRIVGDVFNQLDNRIVRRISAVVLTVSALTILPL